jgi:hypothetical protein
MTAPSENDANRAAGVPERAAVTLGIAPDVPPAAARAAFLRRLTAAGMVPPPEWRSAIRALTGFPARGLAALSDPLANAPGDDSLCADVEAFATSYWSLRPVERRNRWQTLVERCSFDPALAARLRRLEAGLDLEEISPNGDPSRTEELARIVQSLFVLKPAELATRRREQLAALRAPASAWADAARQMLEFQPAVAALEPALIERLTTPCKSNTEWATVVSQPSWGFRVQGGLQVPRESRQPTRQPPSKSGSSARVLLLIGLVLSLVRLVAGSANTTPLVHRYAQPSEISTAEPGLWPKGQSWPPRSEPIVDPALIERYLPQPAGAMPAPTNPAPGASKPVQRPEDGFVGPPWPGDPALPSPPTAHHGGVGP